MNADPQTDAEMFGGPDCTCIPFTRQTNPPRYLNRPTDTVDMISGWEPGRDCPHHAPVPAAAGVVSAAPDQADLRQRIAEALRPHASLGGTPPRYELPYFDGSTPGLPRIAGWKPLDEVVAALSAMLPPPADRAAVLREAAAAIEAEHAREETTEWAQYGELDHETEIGGGYVRASAALLRRLADEAQQQADTETRTPCDQPNACDPDTGELCATHEEEQAHADGEHEHCGVTCEIAMPTELMRNSLLAWAPAGGKSILAELERRAAVSGPRAADDKQDGAHRG